jgi:hypothetical protein
MSPSPPLQNQTDCSKSFDDGQVLTLVDRKGCKTIKKDPSSMGAALYDVVKMEIVRDQVQFTLHPKPQLNKDGRNKPRVVTFDLRGNLAGSRLL